MFGRLISPFLVLALSLCSLSAHADDTLDSLAAMQSKIKALAVSLSEPSKTNFQRMQILDGEKTKLELEMKRILLSEKRDAKTDALHDQSYDRTDDLMLGVTAVSLLRVNPNDMLITEASCDEARGILRIFARNESKVGVNPDHLLFQQVIELMCSQKK